MPRYRLLCKHFRRESEAVDPGEQNQIGTDLEYWYPQNLACPGTISCGKTGIVPNAFKKIDGADLLAGVDVIKVIPRRTRFSDYIEGNELAAIRARDLDLFIRIGFRILRGTS